MIGLLPADFRQTLHRDQRHCAQKHQAVTIRPRLREKRAHAGRDESTAVGRRTILCTGGNPRRSVQLERQLQAWAQLPVTEACVSGLCDMCLCRRTSLCTIFGEGRWKEAFHRPRGKQKRRSGAIQ